jgi:hypothetical protein
MHVRLLCPTYGHVELWERRGVYRVLMRKREGWRPPRRPRLRWEDNIKMDLQEVGCGTWTVLLRLRTRTGDCHL